MRDASLLNGGIEIRWILQFDLDLSDGPLDARKAKLIDVLEDAGTNTPRYLYDCGDGGTHDRGRAHGASPKWTSSIRA
jgi:hypothetical protein